MFDKILIANRGEIALRVLRACKELGIATVAVHSTADADAMHVRLADESVCIGPPPAVESYLNIPRIMAAAEITNADAIHPGYGFLAENAGFAEICAQYNIKFIGPTPAMIRKMGDKMTAKETMIAAGVPCIPGSKALLESVAEAKEMAREMGYPIILKATAGGGGKGMRRVDEASQALEAIQAARREAESAFGDGTLYVERVIDKPRHVEVQIFADDQDHFVHLFERECSVQRRHQKVIEESP